MTTTTIRPVGRPKVATRPTLRPARGRYQAHNRVVSRSGWVAATGSTCHARAAGVNWPEVGWAVAVFFVLAVVALAAVSIVVGFLAISPESLSAGDGVSLLGQLGF